MRKTRLSVGFCTIWIVSGLVRGEQDSTSVKFEALQRVGKTIQASSVVGMSQLQFRDLQKALKTEIEVTRPKIDAGKQVEADALGLYVQALEAMLDYDFMRDLEDQLRAHYKTIHALNPKLAKESPESVRLIGLRQEEKPEQRSALTDRATTIAEKYQLPTEKHTFNTKWYKGTWIYVSAGWDLRLLGLAGERLSAAAQTLEAVKGPDKPKEIKLGMTVADVEAAMGLPKTKADLGEKLIYKYDDMVVEFREGKVVDVKF